MATLASPRPLLSKESEKIGENKEIFRFKTEREDKDQSTGSPTCGDFPISNVILFKTLLI